LIGINLDDEFTASMAGSIFCMEIKGLSPWKPMISCTLSRLGMWKGRLLSMVGHVCLIKNVLNDPYLLLHVHFYYVKTKGIAHVIKSFQRRFAI